MRFKGVVLKKGQNRGDVVEYSPEEKIRVALGIALTKHPEFEGYLVTPSKVTLNGNVQTSKKGDPLKRLWQNNHYEASGRVEVSRRDMARDRLLRPVPYDFAIKVEDCLCHNGLPDLVTTDIELSPV